MTPPWPRRGEGALFDNLLQALIPYAVYGEAHTQNDELHFLTWHF